MNKKLVLSIFTLTIFTHAQITSAQNAQTSNPLPTPLQTMPAQPQTIPANPFAGTPIQTNSITAPATSPAIPQNPKNQKQMLIEIAKQIEKGVAPAKINCYSTLQASIYNNTSTPLFVGFEKGISLSPIPAGNHIEVPAGKNYLVYSENNPTGNALHLSYSNDASKQNMARGSKTQNGAPSFNKNEPQPFTGNAYIALDANKNLMLSKSN